MKKFNRSHHKSVTKEIEMSRYKNKWGMSKYKFFCFQKEDCEYSWNQKQKIEYCLEVYPSGTWYIPETNRSSGLNEIKSLPTLIKRVSSKKAVRLHTGPQKLPSYYGESTPLNYIVFDNFDKFKEYTLIEKLSGL